MIPFGKWNPDLFSTNSAFASEAKGVIPGANSKLPWPSLAAFTNALAATCAGAVLVRDGSGSNQIFAGTSTRLYKLNSSTLAFDNVTRSSGGNYTVPAGDRWQWAVFGDNLYAAQIGDVMQSINMASGTNFAAVSGSPPQVRYIKTIGDQIWAGSDTTQDNRITWCGRNAPTFWATGGGQDCDFQDFPDGGFVRGMVGISSGYVFQDDAIRGFAPSSGREIYSFAKIDDASGILSPDSIVSYLDTNYYLGTDGFRTIGSQGIGRIGLDAVDEWFADTASQDLTQLGLTSGVIDPLRPRVFWAFTTLGSGSTLDHMLCYDIPLQEWTHAEISTQLLLQSATAGYTMEGLATPYPNLDLLTVSLDSRAWAGGSPVLSGFDTDNKLGFFNGPNLQAIAETAEFQAIPGRRTMVTGIRPITDSANVKVNVGTRQTLQTTETASYRGDKNINGRGWAPARASGRYHTVRTTIDAAEDWNDLQGVEVEKMAAGGER